MILPSLALAADLCGSKVPPTGYRIAVGYADGPRARALEAARAKAIENALAWYAADLGPLEQAAFRKQVFDWSEDNWERRTACVRLAIADEAFTLQKDAADRLAADLRALAKKVTAKAVDVAAPTWDSGCKADFGGALRNALVAELTGVRVTSGAPRLAIQLSARADGVFATVTLDEVSIGGFSFPLSLFHSTQGEGGACATNATLGLGGDTRVAAGGLHVSLALSAHQGEACEGDADNPIVTVSAPARVQLYSVDRGGTGHFVGEQEVERSAPIGEGTLVPMDAGGDERLLAVALPHGQSFGPTDAWRDYCRLPAPFDARAFPAGAAIGSATFVVHPAGTYGCPDRPAPEATTAAEAPMCR